MRRLIIIHLSLLIIWGCSTNKPYSVMNPVEGKELVTGVIQVYFNGKCVTNQSSILFNEDAIENRPYQLDYDGRFICNLPAGPNYISKIYYQNVCLKLPENLTRFDLSSNESVNYLGDLSVDWQHSNFQGAMILAGSILGGLIGGMIVWGLTEANPNEYQHQLLYAENNMEEAQEYLNIKYNYGKELINKTFNFPEPGNHFEPEQPVDHSLNPNFLTFTTRNNKVCCGTLRYLKRKKIFVECENKVYVIPKTNLKSITNHSGANISLESISNKSFEPLNYDSYEFINY